MLTSVFHAGGFQIQDVLIAMGAALALGILIALLYGYLRPEDGAFRVILAALPMLVSAVILIVNGNIGTSVAVLGAFGLIRFRSAPGTAWEIGFLFYAMAAGLACGMGFISLALVIVVVTGIAILALEKGGFGRRRIHQRQLRITIPEDLEYDGLFDDLFEQYTLSHELERVKTVNMGTMFELSYLVSMRRDGTEKALIDDIRCRNGNLGITFGMVQSQKNVL
ncbi:MAG: DUF4956 domain-containing protein [Oscillospiraceae bacterium]|nr:DUF4956 domain-containing protein [Oscillospiraceae bacterium]